MGLTAVLLRNQPWIAAAASSLVYLALLLLLGAFRHPDIQRVLQVLPFKHPRSPSISGD
jgi:hypothetical protein